MKNFKIIRIVLLLIAASNTCELMAQITLEPLLSKRTQNLNQYTSVFICSPNNGTIIQDIHDDSDPVTWFNSDKFQTYNAGWVYLAEETPTTTMQPGKGYVIQLGGNGNYTENITDDRTFNFSGGSANNGIVTGPNLTANQFNLLGNPYSNFLDLDLFLLSANNRTKVRGPIMLWTHNTLTSNANVNPNDPNNAYVNSANDFALYNVLGGVAAGRQISTSADVNTPISTGIQTPNGKICFGTGFGIYSISSGNILYDNDMRTDSNGGETQSFRLSDNVTTETKSEENRLAALAPSVRSRIWLNIERGVPPTSGPNFNPLKQILVGYSPCYGADCATVGDSDRVFDAETVTADSNPSIDFYSFAAGSTKKLAIQGRADFLKTDSFKLGYKATVAGTYTFTTTADGIFTSQPYYILDAEDIGANVGVYHTLPYTFTTASGTFDTRFKVVFENLVSIANPACGTRLTDIDNSVYSTVILGATTYKFEVRTVSAVGPILGEYNGPQPAVPHVFNLNFLGIEFDKSYWVSVATYKINGLWQYGPPCKFTTPVSTKTRTLIQCGIILPNVPNNTWTSLSVTNVPIVGIAVERYRFYAKIGAMTFGSPFESSSNSCTLRSFGATLSANTTYSIAAQIKWNGAWQDIGNYCDVSTPSTISRFSQNDFSIFEVSAFPNPFTNNFKISLNTSSDENVSIKAYDMLGRMVESKESGIADFDSQEIGSSFTSGVYNIIVTQGENVKTMRVIKR